PHPDRSGSRLRAFRPNLMPFRPIALNDLPYPSQVRLESADGHWKVLTDPTGRAGFPDVPLGITLANLFIEKAGEDNVAVPGFEWYGHRMQIPADPINDWWATPIPEKYARPLSAQWYQLPVLLQRVAESAPAPQPEPPAVPVEPPHSHPPPLDPNPPPSVPAPD